MYNSYWCTENQTVHVCGLRLSMGYDCTSRHCGALPGFYSILDLRSIPFQFDSFAFFASFSSLKRESENKNDITTVNHCSKMLRLAHLVLAIRTYHFTIRFVFVLCFLALRCRQHGRQEFVSIRLGLLQMSSGTVTGGTKVRANFRKPAKLKLAGCTGRLL